MPGTGGYGGPGSPRYRRSTALPVSYGGPGRPGPGRYGRSTAARRTASAPAAPVVPAARVVPDGPAARAARAGRSRAASARAAGGGTGPGRRRSPSAAACARLRARALRRLRVPVGQRDDPDRAGQRELPEHGRLLQRRQDRHGHYRHGQPAGPDLQPDPEARCRTRSSRRRTARSGPRAASRRPASSARPTTTSPSSGGSLSGGSTITQEFVRGYYDGIGAQQTVSRKVKEIFIAQKLAKTKSKQWILANYMNLIYLGDNSYGVSAAAETYFGKPVVAAHDRAGRGHRGDHPAAVQLPAEDLPAPTWSPAGTTSSTAW